MIRKLYDDLPEINKRKKIQLKELISLYKTFFIIIIIYDILHVNKRPELLWAQAQPKYVYIQQWNILKLNYNLSKEKCRNILYNNLIENWKRFLYYWKKMKKSLQDTDYNLNHKTIYDIIQ